MILKILLTFIVCGIFSGIGFKNLESSGRTEESTFKVLEVIFILNVFGTLFTSLIYIWVKL